MQTDRQIDLIRERSDAAAIDAMYAEDIARDEARSNRRVSAMHKAMRMQMLKAELERFERDYLKGDTREAAGIVIEFLPELLEMVRK